MIIQFDARKAKQGAGPTDHVWKVGLSGTELSALYGLMEAADSVLGPTSPAKAFAENILVGLQTVLDQCRAGKAHPTVTIHSAVPPGLDQEIGLTPPLVLTGQGEYVQAWPPEPGAVPPPGSGAPTAKATPATIPYPENGDHACSCPTN